MHAFVLAITKNLSPLPDFTSHMASRPTGTNRRSSSINALKQLA
jgi:hypothetical protein